MFSFRTTGTISVSLKISTMHPLVKEITNKGEFYSKKRDTDRIIFFLQPMCW